MSRVNAGLSHSARRYVSASGVGSRAGVGPPRIEIIVERLRLRRGAAADAEGANADDPHPAALGEAQPVADAHRWSRA